MATDMDARRTGPGPQFTHGKLLEAATLLRLPVDLLAGRLGLAPDVATASVSLDQLPMPGYDMREALLSRGHGAGYPGYLDQGQSRSVGASSLGSRISQSASPGFAEEHVSVFQKLGFELQRLGPETLAIRQIPALLKQAEANCPTICAR